MMLESCKVEFIEMMHLQGVIDEPLCLGFGMDFSDIEVGMQFISSPNFAFKMSTDSFTLEDSLKWNRGHWKLDFHGSVESYYNDKFEVMKICKRLTRTRPFAFLRVKNLRTNVDFDILRNRLDEFEIHEYDTHDLYFIQ